MSSTRFRRSPSAPCRRRSASFGCLLAFALAFGSAAPALARSLAVPIRIDHAFLRAQMVSQLFAEPGESTRPWSDASGCTSLVLSQPELTTRDGALHLLARFDAELAAGTGGFCIGGLRRQGRVDAQLEARVAPGSPALEFRVVRSEFFNTEGVRFSGVLWDALRGLLHPQLDTLRLDLARPFAELRAFLPALLPEAEAARARQLADSLALGDVGVQGDAIAVDLRLEAPEPEPERAAPSPEPALSPAEIARWEEAWQSWDAFLTFLVEHTGRRSDDVLPELRETFLVARYDIAAILAPSRPRAPDPVEPLFLETWERLAPLLRRASLGLPGEEALQYLTLIAAADAYRALARLGPAYGIALSRDGLRRMARMLEPAPRIDPTAWDDVVDAELRALFGFGAPLPVEPGPGARVFPSWPPLAVGPFVVLAADASERPLDAWVPARAELDAYLERVRDLLGETALLVQQQRALPFEYAPLFRSLVVATAWQETCWRQYVRRRGEVRPITSSVGAVGIMQVSPYVWRGFYDAQALRGNTRYNAEAGAEILHHYLVDYAIRKGEDRARGRSDDLARATYAAYNAGPRQLARYRRPGRAQGGIGHRIDADFWRKYQEVRSGNDLGVRACYPGLAT